MSVSASPVIGHGTGTIRFLYDCGRAEHCRFVIQLAHIRLRAGMDIRRRLRHRGGNGAEGSYRCESKIARQLDRRPGAWFPIRQNCYFNLQPSALCPTACIFALLFEPVPIISFIAFACISIFMARVIRVSRRSRIASSFSRCSFTLNSISGGTGRGCVYLSRAHFARWKIVRWDARQIDSAIAFTA